MYGMIATWRMALEGMEKGLDALCEKKDAETALETAIREVEDFPYYKSVGYGGLPNEEGEVELDAGFMNGNTLGIGAIMAVHDCAHPISIARALSKEEVNCVLSGEGAEKYAHFNGFERKNMLTDRAKWFYNQRVKENAVSLKPYAGHDTVGMVSLDQSGLICAGTSTSGLFMKKKGRVGDSPLVGSGFYADAAIGGAVATGLGEDLMKGCISYEIVRFMQMGMTVQNACETAVRNLDEKLRSARGKAGDLSVVAMDRQGHFGCAANIDGFSFVVGLETLPLTVYLCRRNADGTCGYEKASEEWMSNYMKERMRPLGERNEK